MILRGGRVLLRTGVPKDADALTRIRAEDEVYRWWGEFRPEDLDAYIGSDSRLVVEVDGVVVGGIEYHEDDEDPMYRHAGIDIFLDPGHHGAGLGTEAVSLMARFLFQERGHHRLTIDPAADNLAAIRAYEKVGFRPVGIMRQYERRPDGSRRDGLLMDMLATELDDRDAS